MNPVPDTTGLPETAAGQAEECLVCLNGLDDGQHWTCSTCHKRCHMLCIMQWTLRLSINERRSFSGFTCPGCRSRHSIATLPGFEQQPAPSRHRPGRTRDATTTTTTTTSDALRRAFGFPRTDDDVGSGSNEGGAIVELIEEDDSDEDDDDESDDEISDPGGGRFVVRISAERIYFDVNTLNVHSR